MTAGDASVLANVRLDGDRTVDIVIRDGRIEEIAPDLAEATPAATRIEGDGLLALPGLVDGHIHLDKTLTGLAWIGFPSSQLSRSSASSRAVRYLCEGVFCRHFSEIVSRSRGIVLSSVRGEGSSSWSHRIRFSKFLFHFSPELPIHGMLRNFP